MHSRLLAGISRIDISPAPGLQLSGYPHYDRANTGIHDPLYASCIFLDNGKEKLAIVSLDLLKYPKKYVRSVRKRVEEKTGIPGGNIMICSIHTHSGPEMTARFDLEGIERELKPDAENIHTIEDRIVSMIIDAYNHPFPAKIGIGKGYCGKEQGVGGNRRNPDGLADPEVWVIGLKDSSDRWKGCAVRYALHPTVIHGESRLVTADYPCYVRKFLEESKPGLTAMFLQGTSGNQSPRYFRSGQTFEEAKRIGESIGKEAGRVLDTMTFSSNVDLSCTSIETAIDIRILPTMEKALDDISYAKEKLKILESQNAPYVQRRTAEVDLLGAENIYGYVLAQSKGYPIDVLVNELPVEVQVIGIDDARIVGIQGEMFVEYSYAIKAASPFEKTFVIELANGCLPGYVCTREAYAEGGYEAGTSMLTAKSGDTLVETASALLEKTK